MRIRRDWASFGAAEKQETCASLRTTLAPDFEVSLTHSD